MLLRVEFRPNPIRPEHTKKTYKNQSFQYMKSVGVEIPQKSGFQDGF